jgi:hypothetical protein
MEYVDVPPDPLDVCCQVIFARPEALLVVVLLPMALIFLGLLSIMPHHFHRKHPMLSRRAPQALVLVVIACVYWIVANVQNPVQLLCRRVVPVSPRAADKAALLLREDAA